jgi:ornithine cyclodeaminase/alanine dehydrogenase-like protein (mu-crystallin family)
VFARLSAPRTILCRANEERERERIRMERQEVRIRALEAVSESQHLLKEADIVLTSTSMARISANQ